VEVIGRGDMEGLEVDEREEGRSQVAWGTEMRLQMPRKGVDVIHASGAMPAV
jgi:hypothetical protein